jgi:stage II sporulation protein D
MKHFYTLILAILLIILTAADALAFDIRIGLKTRVAKSSIGAQHDSAIVAKRTNKPLIKINRMEKYSVYAENNTVLIKKDSVNKVYNTGQDAIYIIPVDNNSLVYCDSRWYRGSLKLLAKGNYITVVNVVELEDYIKGVVPAEMPANWNTEALKAQAIAARSYALANLNKRRSEGYDLDTSTNDQVYKGASAETYRSNVAVETTRGQVIVHNGRIIPAYYHSSSGGVTENDAWSGKIGFVRIVRDYDQQSPRAQWSKILEKNQISSKLSARGYSVGELSAILPVSRTETGRIKKLRLTGTAGSALIDGEQFRKMFDLPSSLYSIYINSNNIIINGKGSGHGVGMSQWGAKDLADRGYNAYQILGYYFNDVSIKTLSSSNT